MNSIRSVGTLRRPVALLSLSLLAMVSALAQPAAKRPLNHRDYDSWRVIQRPVLSRDGKFLAYALFPEEGDGTLVVRNIATGKEVRENLGTPPAVRESADPEGPPPDLAPGAGTRIVFSYDNRFVAATGYPTKAATDAAVKERKRPDEMPKPSLVLVDVTAMSASRVADVASFQLPEAGESFLAYLKGPKPGQGAAAAEATPGDSDGRSARDQRAGGRGGAAGGRGARKLGSDLMLRDLRTSGAAELKFEDVAEYSMSKDAKTLLYAVSSSKEETNGIYAVAPGSAASASALLAGKGRYSKIAWDLMQRQAAFLSDRDDAAAKAPKFKAYLWDRKSPAAAEIVGAATPGFRAGFAIADRGTLTFSRDGARLFISCAPADLVVATSAEPAPSAGAAAPAAGRGAASDKAVADLWNWKDDYVQPMQKVRAAQDRARSYLGVWDIAGRKFTQLADPTMAGVTPSDGRYALGTDDRAYRHMVDYDGNFSDLYIVDTVDGTRKLVLQKQRGGGGGAGRGGRGASPWAPDSKHVLAFRDKQWWSIQAPDGKSVNLSGNLGAAFFDEEHDTPDEAPAYGIAGWTKDSKWALLYDRYDVWAVAADGSTSKKITDGRASNLQFRLSRSADEPVEEDRGVDPAKPILFRVENLETRDSGFYSLASMDKGQPQRLLMGPKNYRALGKAKDADVVLVTATTFRDQPDLHVTDSSFRQLKKVTDANPQQAGINWGTGELTQYRNADGVELKAALYKPENFDPTKRYPMMVYLYERLSQNVNNFVRPAPGHSINFAYYVSNGYLVLTPDIVYTTGHPGQSALKCILPAVQAVVDKGFVNRNAIGIQGHSWGGYQTAYLVTQTNLFKAAEAGAPVANMISAYDGIRWGTGLPRQFQYEKTQSRIGGSLWDSPLQFIENSPIFSVNRITTPLLILHNDADDAVPWYQGIELFLSMRRLGKEAYLFNYNGEPHHLNRRPNQKDYTVRMQQFFDHLLKDAAKPDWMDKGISYNDRESEKEKFITIYSEDPEAKKDAKK
jgi:dipeptidyl aminopeptidase/acylaminoacyl peptidase